MTAEPVVSALPSYLPDYIAAVDAQRKARGFRPVWQSLSPFFKTSIVVLRHEVTGRYSVGMAVCSDKDRYSKGFGRALATQRAMAAFDNEAVAFIPVRHDQKGLRFFKLLLPNDVLTQVLS